MEYVVAGASGFLGRALCTALTNDGHRVTRLVRRTARAADESTWDPAAGRVDSDVLGSADVVVNLAGANIGRIPWTKAYRRTLKDSRLQTTGTLAEAIAGLDPAPVFVAQSAIGFYPKDTGEELDEDAPAGDSFLGDLVRDWEAASRPAEEAGARVVRLRTGLVLDRSGGSFPRLLLPFRFGVGGRLGPGTQWMGVISLDDWLAAVRYVVEHEDCRGPYNLVIPEPPTNAEFTKALGTVLHRPTAIPVPAPLIRAVLGEFSVELLGSVRLRPRRLLEAGFAFEQPDVESVLRAAV